MGMEVRKAVIPAAGLGTRFLPATKSQPKEMFPIVDKPAVQYIIEEAVEAGIRDILVITGRNKSSIEEHFDKSIELELELERKGKEELQRQVQDISYLANIHFIRQKEPMGLGHAVYCARSFIGNETFAVLLGDDIVQAEKPCLKQLLEAYSKYYSPILGVQEVDLEDVSKYGIVEGSYIEDRVYKVEGLIEKPEKKKAPSKMAIMGRYIVTPAIFEMLRSTRPGRDGEIQLTDALKKLAIKEGMYAYVFTGTRYDVGDKLGFLKATVDFALQREELREGLLEFLNLVIKRNNEEGRE